MRRADQCTFVESPSQNVRSYLQTHLRAQDRALESVVAAIEAWEFSCVLPSGYCCVCMCVALSFSHLLTRSLYTAARRVTTGPHSCSRSRVRPARARRRCQICSQRVSLSAARSCRTARSASRPGCSCSEARTLATTLQTQSPSTIRRSRHGASDWGCLVVGDFRCVGMWRMLTRTRSRYVRTGL